MLHPCQYRATAFLLDQSCRPISMTRDLRISSMNAQLTKNPLDRALHLADLITEMNGIYALHPSITNIDIKPLTTIVASKTGFCGFMSILSSLRYCLGPPDDHTNMWIALAFIPFGLFFDFMDGKVARWRKKSSLMGQELDSLADLVGLSIPFLLQRLPLPLRHLRSLHLCDRWRARGFLVALCHLKQLEVLTMVSIYRYPSA